MRENRNRFQKLLIDVMAGCLVLVASFSYGLIRLLREKDALGVANTLESFRLGDSHHYLETIVSSVYIRDGKYLIVSIIIAILGVILVNRLKVEIIRWLFLVGACMATLSMAAELASVYHDTIGNAHEEQTMISRWSEDVSETRALLLETGSIVHAAGEVLQENGDYIAYANSVEGLKNCEERGVSFIEIDLEFTSDNYLVCLHDWSESFLPGLPEGKRLTLDEFMNCKIYGEFTPMWIGDVADFLERTKDTYIVTDIKNDNVLGAKQIAKQYPHLLDRFVVQIYHEYEYDDVIGLGFKNIIYTLYRLEKEERHDTKNLRMFSETHNLICYTFPTVIDGFEEYVDEMKYTGVPLFVHTVNEMEEKEYYLKVGIDGFYTDRVVKRD